MFAYESLDVYRCAISFAEVAFRLVRQLPRGHGVVADQLRRATMSIALNIAEGTGRATAADCRQFYAVARGSAMECGAIVDVVRLIGTAGHEDLAAAKQLLYRIVAMLSKMCL